MLHKQNNDCDADMDLFGFFNDQDNNYFNYETRNGLIL